MLKALTKLDFSANQIEAVPAWLRSMENLSELRIGNNAIQHLPTWLGELTSLREIEISGVKLGTLPHWLTNLGQLQSLSLSRCGLTHLDEVISTFSQLRNLDVSDNRLKALPNVFSRLKKLRDLDVSKNILTALPDELPKLNSLDASENDLKDLPSSLRKLRSLRMLMLQGNSSLGIPIEIVGRIEDKWTESSPDPSRILEYFFRSTYRRKALNEAKLIFVGRGGVGKTSLIKRLIRNSFDKLEKETAGIEIEPWAVTLPDGDDVRLHIWDFGGQEILHATHQFFLTERSVYALVLSGREGSAPQDAEYWLQLIRSFGAKSSVIIVLNKSRQHPFELNRGLLIEKYPFIAGFVATDCEDATGIAAFRDALLSEVQKLEHRKASFPEDWFTIKEHLARMEDNYLTWQEYQQLCGRLGETNPDAQRELAEFLHILGVALNYSDDIRLRDTHVLNPRWVTEGIYSVIRSGQKAGSEGVVAKGDLGSILDRTKYPEGTHSFLLTLMEKFQLCFPLEGRIGQYLVPELLGENQPDLHPFLDAPGLAFRYQYEILPEGLLPRFIVQTHTLSTARGDLRWRTGVVLTRDACSAVIRADAERRRIDVHVVGSKAMRRAVLAIVRENFDRLHGELKGLIIDQRVPILGEHDVTIGYQHLLGLEEDGIKECRPEGMRSNVNVAELLNGLETTSSRRLRRVPSSGKVPRAGQLKLAHNPTLRKEKDKCRILFLAANPDGATAIATDEESREIAQKIRAADHRDLLEVMTRWAIRSDDLLQYLNEFRPHVVHFSGHGTDANELVLLDNNRRPKAVSKAALQHLFKVMKKDIRLVVLNACFSQLQAKAVTEFIDCSIGMTKEINDDAAIVFAASFYRALGFGASVREAFDQGISALLVEGIPQEDVPTLHSRNGVDASSVYLLLR